MEQLIPDLYYELCVELLKEYPKRPENLHAFAISGKEPFNVLTEVCKSVHALKISNVQFCDSYASRKWVMDVHAEHGERRRSDFSVDAKFRVSKLDCAFDFEVQNVKDYFMSRLFKSTKALILHLFELKQTDNDWCIPYLDKLEYLEELALGVSDCRHPDRPFIKDFMKRIGPVKRMTACLEVYVAISEAVTDYKLDKMTVHVCDQRLNHFLELPSFIPTELEMLVDGYIEYCFENEEQFKLPQKSGNFDGVKKLKIKCYSEVSAGGAAFVCRVIRLMETWFPSLEELVFEHGFHYDNSDRYDYYCFYDNETIVPHVDYLRKFLQEYHGKLQLKIEFCLKTESDSDLSGLIKSFSGYDLSHRGDDYNWKNAFKPAPNVSLNVDILIHKVEYSDEDDDDDGNV